MASDAQVTSLQQENAALAAAHEALKQTHEATMASLEALKADYDSLRQQLDWFRRQLFGRQSEKRLDIDTSEQANLFASLGVDDPTPPAEEVTEEITYRRRKARGKSVNEQGLRFDASVPVTTIEVRDPAIEAIPEAERVVVGEKVTHRLAQHPASYEVLRYVRQVVKRRDTGQLITARSPANVLERTVADVSLLAGILTDKFCHHLPLYRQHGRMADAGIVTSRSSLTRWAGQAIDLLAPIEQAQMASVLTSDLLLMDETPIKAGRKAPGKMRQAWFWPIYGDQDEIVFRYAPTREQRHVETFLGDYKGQLVTDGNPSYVRYAARRDEVVHCQCWAHARRPFERARESEPATVDVALSLIGALYRNEKTIRRRKLKGAAKLAYRREHSTPVVVQFFDWCRQQCRRPDLLPKSPLAKALNYALEREAGLSVFLTEPDVPPDTNHLERSIRPIPMGRRNWLFAWTEIGAERVGMIQSLLVTCRLHGVDPYTYLVDVLQRVGQHPASRVIELTPRVWKTMFAEDPLRSDLYRARNRH